MNLAVLIATKSQYQVLDHFAEKLHEALLRCHVRSTLCPLDSGGLHYLLKDLPTATLQFNGALTHNDTGLRICDLLEIPHLLLALDPIYRFWGVLGNPRIYLASDDRNYVTWLKHRGIERTFFFPHGVERELAEEKREEKKYPIAYLASWIDCEGLRDQWKENFDAQVVDVMEAVIAEATKKDYFSVFEELYPQLPANVRFRYFSGDEILIAIEVYLKGKYRLELLKAMQPHQVHLFGNGLETLPWGRYFSEEEQERLILHGQVSYKEALLVTKQSQILLHSGLPHKDGGHERVFTAPLCSSLIVTQKNPFLEETFEDEKSLIFYDQQQLEGLGERLTPYVKNSSLCDPLIEEGKKQVLRHHTWDHRAALLVDAVNHLIL